MERLRKYTEFYDDEGKLVRRQFEHHDASIYRLVLSTEGGWQGTFIPAPEGVEVPKISIEQKPAELTDESKKAEGDAKRTWTLTGRVKGNVREGRPDGAGKPTMWARVAAHQDGSEEAWMLSTTFHRHSANLARGLKPEDQITFEGYLRPTQQEGKMDSFSVFHLIDYPGKPAKAES